ncbi:MAG: DUF4412 domain-containing protein [Acidobacteriota bacterium]
MKTTVFQAGKPVSAFIMDLSAQMITQINYGDRSYITSTIQEFVQTMKGAVNTAMKQMEEALKQVPPEQRKMMEEMMRSQMPKQEDCPEAKTELRRTGHQETIAGYTAIRYDVLVDGKMTSELWISKGIDAWKEIDPEKLQKLSAEFEKLAGCGNKTGLSVSDPSWKVVAEGFPMRTVMKMGEVTVIELVKAESKAIPAAEFQPPAGFARKTWQEMMHQ